MSENSLPSSVHVLHAIVLKSVLLAILRHEAAKALDSRETRALISWKCWWRGRDRTVTCKPKNPWAGETTERPWSRSPPNLTGSPRSLRAVSYSYMPPCPKPDPTSGSSRFRAPRVAAVFAHHFRWPPCSSQCCLLCGSCRPWWRSRKSIVINFKK